MAKRLLDRQVSLLAYLTSGAAIFGERDNASLDPALQDIDRALLHLEARFSHEKRMEKIVAVFPRTFEILGDRRAAITQEFVEACPPVDISRLANAGQFHNFFSTRGRRESAPPYLRDVMACELAFAKVRVAVEERELEAERGKTKRLHNVIRRCPGVALLRCIYDVRPIFEQGLNVTTPEKRDTALAVAMPPGAGDPLIFELLPVVFDLLAALDDWTDPVAFGETAEMEGLIADLLEHGLIEVGR
jgi:hypothetical protein